jgi:hypothetical protein
MISHFHSRMSISPPPSWYNNQIITKES